MAKTRVGILLDESGSMMSQHDEVVSNVNEYISALAGGSKADRTTKVTAQTFAARGVAQTRAVATRWLMQEQAAAEAPVLSREDYRPGGGTPLNDATVNFIHHMEQVVGEKKAKVQIVIATDGLENSSVEHSLGDVRALIERKEKDGWGFIYLAATPQERAQAQAMGIRSANTLQYDPMSASSRGTAMAAATQTANSLSQEGYQQALASTGGLFDGAKDAEEVEKRRTKR